MRGLIKSLGLILIVCVVTAGCDRVIDTAQHAESPETQVFSEEKYFANGSCDATVPEDYSVIQDAIDNANGGETVCVRSGTYKENISVSKAITLRGVNSANSGKPAVIDGWISLDADGAELYRVVVIRSNQINAPNIDAFGVRVQASNTVVADNIVRGLSGESKAWGAINGIQVFGGTSISNINVRNNKVHDFENKLQNSAIGGVAGIKLQADLNNVKVTDNSISDIHSAGWGYGIVLQTSNSASGVPKNIHVERNSVSGVNDGTVYDHNDDVDSAPYPGSAFGIDGAKADEVTLLYNNLLAPNGAESKDDDNPLVATCNWWGDRTGPTHDDNTGGEGSRALERGSASIDFEPWLISPSPGKACRGDE